MSNRIICCSRSKAEKFVPIPEGDSPNPWYCISITDPGAPPAKLSSDFAGIMRLSFDDYEPATGAHSRAWESSTLAAPIPFNAEMAKDLAEAIDTVIDDADQRSGDVNFLVHCEMGISRSNSVARAIQQVYSIADAVEFMNVDPEVMGNSHVYDTLYPIMSDICDARLLESEVDDSPSDLTATLNLLAVLDMVQDPPEDPGTPSW
jgi:predicted protein tyrosine phosphatase